MCFDYNLEQKCIFVFPIGRKVYTHNLIAGYLALYGERPLPLCAFNSHVAYHYIVTLHHVCIFKS